MARYVILGNSLAPRASLSLSLSLSLPLLSLGLVILFLCLSVNNETLIVKLRPSPRRDSYEPFSHYCEIRTALLFHHP